jgi:hypothetical protein
VAGNEHVAVISTGSGLKDVAGAMKAVAAVGTHPITIPPDVDALSAALRDGGLDHPKEPA